MLLGVPCTKCTMLPICGYRQQDCQGSDPHRCCHCLGWPCPDGYPTSRCVTNGWQETLSGDLRFVRGDDGVPDPDCQWELRGTGKAVWFAPMICRPNAGPLGLSDQIGWYGAQSPFSAIADIFWDVSDGITRNFKAWLGFVGSSSGFIVEPSEVGVGASPFLVRGASIFNNGDYDPRSGLDVWPSSRPLMTDFFEETVPTSSYPIFNVRLSLHCDHNETGGAYDGWVILMSYDTGPGVPTYTHVNSYGPVFLQVGAPSVGIVAFGVERASESTPIFAPRSNVMIAACSVPNERNIDAVSVGTGRSMYPTCYVGSSSLPNCQVIGDGAAQYNSSSAPPALQMSGGSLAAAATHPIGTTTALLPFSLSQILAGDSWLGADGGGKTVGPYTLMMQDNSQNTGSCVDQDPGANWLETIWISYTVGFAGEAVLSIYYACTKPSGPPPSTDCLWHQVGAVYVGTTNCASSITMSLVSVGNDCPPSDPCPPFPIDESSFPPTITLSI